LQGSRKEEVVRREGRRGKEKRKRVAMEVSVSVADDLVKYVTVCFYR